ncbi:hypothetical protein [Sphingomonas sp. SRS2]|uniref:hypothetical protein n=1 Tax=Sphingomonas sp. SRS2 TaxID=133190 RepID=UPI000A029AC8|nr:hypothetical protein [Sphingomonas sp. SRS2]
MFEPKPMASLSGNLLARKGEALPAMRRSHLPASAAAPREQQARIAQSFAHPTEELPVVEAILPRNARAAFTLRLDPDRHLRLRLASAVGKRSAQQIATEALDAFLDGQPGLDALLAQARRTPPNGEG